jgi:hypothetical protein
MSEERFKVLEMLRAGEISPQQAMELLKALGEESPADMAESEGRAPIPPDGVRASGDWWIYPTAAGAVVMAMGAPLAALGLTKRLGLFWAIGCGWVPLLTGMLAFSVGVWSRSARWFHLRIKDTETGGQTFGLSLPLPLSLTARLVRMAQPYVPQLQETGVDEAILALQEAVSKDQEAPFYIDVHAGARGEQILIWLD